MKRKPPILQTSIAAALALAPFLTPQAAEAAPVYWDLDDTVPGAGGAAPSGAWDSTSLFWNSAADGSGAGAAWAPGDTAVFSAGTDATGSYTITISGTQSVGGLVFEEGTVSITGGLLNLGAGFSADVALGLTATLGSDLAGGGGFVKTGDGTLVLSGAANTFTGGVTLGAGTLRISGDAVLGDPSNTLTLNGGTLNATGVMTSARAISLGGDTIVNLSSGAHSWSGQITGAGGFTKKGSGSLELTGSTVNSNGSPIAVHQGTLTLNKAGVNAIGAGGLAITSNNTAGFGAAIVSLSAGEQIDNSAPVSINANGGQRAGIDLNNFTETVGPVTISSTTFGTGTIALGATGRLILNGDLTLRNNRNAGGNTGREVMITGTGNYDTPNAGGTVDFGGVARSIIVESDFTQANSDATIEATIANGSVIKAGSRVLRLGAENTFSALTVNEGTVRAMVDGAIPAGIPLTVTAPTAGTTATLDFGGFDYTITPVNNLKLGGGAGASNIATGAGTLMLTTDISYDATNDGTGSLISGKLDLGGNRTFNVGDSINAVSDLAISANVTGVGDIVKTGMGTLTLRAQNTGWAGNLLINQGTLRVDSALANNTEFNNIFGAAGNGIIIDGGTFNGAHSDRTISGRVVTIGAGGATFDINGTYIDFVESGFSQTRFTAGGNSTVLSGSGPLVKNGGGRVQFQNTSPNFSGPITINDGTFEASGPGMGDSSDTNTVTINGGNWALSGNSDQPLVTLNGGALSSNGASRTVNGKVVVASESRMFLNNFWTDAAAGHSLTLNGEVSGTASLIIGVNRAGYDNNSGAVILRNAANTYSGQITVQSNLKLENNATDGVGKTIGSASVVLAGGHLRLRDNGAGSDGVLTDYSVNNVTVTDTFGGGDLIGTATIDVNRASGSSAGNTFRMGTLTIGSQTLDVIGGNRYSVEFSGLTTFADNPTLNVDTVNLTLAGGVTSGGGTFVKNGAGTLRILGASDITGFTLNAGTIELPTAPAGSGRDIALPLGTGFGAGYVATQANLLDRITTDSEGVVALGVDSTFDPNFSAFVNGPTGQRLRLGGTANATLTGVITPHTDNIVRLGGGGGTLTLASTNAITGAVNVDVNTSGTLAGMIVLSGANNFSGTVTIGGGMTLRAGSNASLGTNPAAIVLDNGTLSLANGGDFAGLATRSLDVAAGGAALDTGDNSVTIAGIAGAGSFTKSGTGKLTLTAANAGLTGNVVVADGTLTVTDAGALGVTTAGTGVAEGGTLELSGGVTIAGEALNIRGTGFGDGGALRNAAGSNSWNATVTLGADASIISVTPGDLLTINGGATSINGANDLTIGGDGDIRIAGTGSNTVTQITSFTKVGSGTVTLANDTNYTGSTTVQAGTLIINNNVDSNVTVNDGATLITTGTNGVSDANTVTLDAGGAWDLRNTDTISRLFGSGTVQRGTSGTSTLILNSGADATFSGKIEDGAGTVAVTKNNNNTVTFEGASTYTGTTTIGSGTLLVHGDAGSITGSAQIVASSSTSRLILGSHSDTVTALDRIGDTSQIELQDAAEVIFNGSSSISSMTTETIGQFETNGGHNIVTLSPASGAQLEITATNATTGLLRSNRGTLLIRGTNLGAVAGTADSSRLILATAPALAGGGGAAGSPTISIIPYAVGHTDTISSGSTFVTHDANGVRPLTAAEYATTIADTAITQNNVMLSSAVSLDYAGSINALRMESGGSIDLGRGVLLNIASGAILDNSAAGTTISGGALEFGSAEAIFYLAGADPITPITLTVNSGLRNTGANGGLTVSASNNDSTLVLAGANGITGEVSINRGVLQLNHSAALNPFSRNNLRLAAQGANAQARLRLNGNDANMGRMLGQTDGFIENGADTPATIRLEQITSDQDAATVLLDGSGAGLLHLVKSGDRRLSFTADSNSWTGTATVQAGVLEVKNGADWDNLGGVIIEGGTFKWYNTTGSGGNNNNRLPDDMTVTFRGGTLQSDHNNNTSENSTERVGTLRLEGGVNQIQVDRFTTTTRQSTVVFNRDDQAENAVERLPGAVARFQAIGTGAVLGDSQQGRIQLGQNTPETASSVALIKNGILHEGGVAYAVVGDDFATINATDLVSGGTNMDHSVAAIGSGGNTGSYHTVTDATAWTGTQNVKLTSAVTTAPAGPTAINSLILGDTVDLDLNGQTLAVDSGGILAITTTTAKTIGNGNLTAGNFAGNEIVLRTGDDANTSGAGAVTLSANVIDASGANPTSLTKWGAPDLTLSGTSTFSGSLNITQGKVIADSVSRLGTAAAGRTLRLGNGARLDLSGSMASEILPFDTIVSSTIGQGIIHGARDQVLSFTGSISGHGGVRFMNAVNATLTSPLNLRDDFILGDDDTGVTTNALPQSTVALFSGDNVVGGNLAIGTDQRTSVVTQNGGTLTVGFQQFNPDLNIGIRGADSGTTTVPTSGTLDLTGAAKFSAQVNNFRVGTITTGSGGNSTAQGALILAQDNDIRVGNLFLVGDSVGSGNQGVTSSVTFGSGNNTLAAPTVVIGGSKSTANATIAAGGTLTLTGPTGGTANLSIGDQRNIDTGTLSTGTMDLTGGTFIAALDQLEIGDKGRTTGNGGQGGAVGTLIIGSSAANEITALSVTLGRMQRSTNTENANTIGSGTLNFGGGTFSVLGDVTMADWSDGVGGDGGAARGILNITGGTFTIAGNIAKTDSDRSSALVTIDGGTLDLQHQASGDTTTGTLTASQLAFRSGSLVDVSQITLDGRGVTNGNTFAPLDNALIVRDTAIAAQVALTGTAADQGGILYEAAGGGSGATLTGTLDLGTVARQVTVEDSAGAQKDLVISGAISGTSDLTKRGAGVLLLSGANIDYAGTTLVAEGALGIHGTLASSISGVMVAPGATIGGKGVINRPVTVDGAIASVTGAGTLDIGAALTLGANSSFTLEMGGAMPGDGNGFYSQVNMTSAADSITLDGTSTIALTLAQGYIPEVGQAFYLLTRADALAFSSAFANAAEGATIDLGFGMEGTITYKANWTGNQATSALTGGNDVALLVTVPEPGTATSLLVGCAMVLGFRRSRRRS